MDEIKLCATCSHRTTANGLRNTNRCGYSGDRAAPVGDWFDRNWERMDGKGGQHSPANPITTSCPGHAIHAEYRRWVVTSREATSSTIVRGTGRVLAIGLTYQEARTTAMPSGSLIWSDRSQPDPQRDASLRDGGTYVGDPKVDDHVRYDLRTCEVFDPEAEARMAAEAFDAVFGTEEP